VGYNFIADITGLSLFT